MNQTVSTSKKVLSLVPLFLAAMFMLTGMMALVYLGRDKSTIVNSPMTELDLVPILNTEQKVSDSSLLGKVTVLHFWGTWSPPCVEEYPKLSKLMAKLTKDPNLQLISVSCSSGMEKDIPALKESTLEFLARFDDTSPVYADPVAYTRGKIASLIAKGGFGYPTTLVVDSKGIIRQVYRGPVNFVQLEKGILELTSSIPSPGSSP